jgi:hypothetical protein
MKKVWSARSSLEASPLSKAVEIQGPVRKTIPIEPDMLDLTAIFPAPFCQNSHEPRDSSNALVRRKATAGKYIGSTGKAERQRRGSAARRYNFQIKCLGGGGSSPG